MISYTPTSGNIEVINTEDSCTVILDNYKGTLSAKTACVYLKFILKGDSLITTDISLTNHNKLDTIWFEGKGSCEVQTLQATSIEIHADLIAKHLIGNVVRIEGCELKGSITQQQTGTDLYSPISKATINSIADHTWIEPATQESLAISKNTIDRIISGNSGSSSPYSISTDAIDAILDNTWIPLVQDSNPLIQSKGHVWLVDCVLKNSSYVTCILSPYILIDNSDIEIQSISKAIDTPNAISIENCSDASYDAIRFSSQALVVDKNSKPKNFLYVILKNSNGSVKRIASREKLYSNTPAKRANPYDLFKDSTQYTDVNLHRRIDQEGIVLKGRGLNYITDEMIYTICYPVYNGISFPRINYVTSTIWSNPYTYETEAILPAVIDSIIEGEEGTSSDYRITKYAINHLIDHTYIYPGDTLKEGSRTTPIYTSDDWEAMTDEVINQICAEIYAYDGHPHSSDVMSPTVVTQIMDETYSWPKTNKFDLDESSSRQYEVGIYSLNSYRTTEYKFYDAGTEVTEDRELP